MANSSRTSLDPSLSKYSRRETSFEGGRHAWGSRQARQFDDRLRVTAPAVQMVAAPREIGFYLYPGFSALDLSGPLEVFTTCVAVARTCEYRMSLLSRLGGPVAGSGGLQVMTIAPSNGTLDTLIVIGGPDIEATNDDEIRTIRALSATARRTASICSGAFLIASTGAANGRRIATRWQDAERLQRRFPKVIVERDRLFVRDGSIWSSAGMTAAIDLAIALVDDDCGQDVALAIARRLVMEKRRNGTESQRSQMLELEPTCDRVARVLSYMHRHLNEDLSVERLAEVARLGPRQFGRVFRRQTGETPARAVERLRAEAAKARVDKTNEPIELIALSVGFSNAERMRRAFLRRFGRCPQASRREQSISPLLSLVETEEHCFGSRSNIAGELSPNQ